MVQHYLRLSEDSRELIQEYCDATSLLLLGMTSASGNTIFYNTCCNVLTLVVHRRLKGQSVRVREMSARARIKLFRSVSGMKDKPQRVNTDFTEALRNCVTAEGDFAWVLRKDALNFCKAAECDDIIEALIDDFHKEMADNISGMVPQSKCPLRMQRLHFL